MLNLLVLLGFHNRCRTKASEMMKGNLTMNNISILNLNSVFQSNFFLIWALIRMANLFYVNLQVIQSQHPSPSSTWHNLPPLREHSACTHCLQRSLRSPPWSWPATPLQTCRRWWPECMWWWAKTSPPRTLAAPQTHTLWSSLARPQSPPGMTIDPTLSIPSLDSRFCLFFNYISFYTVEDTFQR